MNWRTIWIQNLQNVKELITTTMTTPNESEIEEKLAKLKKLFDKGLISESDYNKKKDALLEDL